MKVLILAGGLGTRISEETANKPKPMVSINGNPILWHLMNIYANQGFNEFVVATGYKGEVIEEWLLKGTFITDAEFGTMSWDSEEVVEISLTLQYDWAFLNF